MKKVSTRDIYRIAESLRKEYDHITEQENDSSTRPISINKRVRLERNLIEAVMNGVELGTL